LLLYFLSIATRNTAIHLKISAHITMMNEFPMIEPVII
jgi:hypothetical protein